MQVRLILKIYLSFWLLTTIIYGQDDSLRVIPRYIRKILIERQDVFPEITGKPRFVYVWANKLHIVTKEKIIRQQLLFKPGALYDPELLEESERNLRRLGYIGDVTIKPLNEDSTFVDISVVTQDQWSTLLSTIFRSEGKRTILGASIEEFNLLGFGKHVFTEFRHEPEGNIISLSYTDPLLMGSRWTTRVAFERGPFIDLVSARLVRPFYSLDTRWAGGVSFLVRNEKQRLFEQGEEISRVLLETNDARWFIARALGSRFDKTRLQLTYRFSERNFSALDSATTTPVPDDEKIHSLTLTLSFENLSFVEEKRIDKFLRTEDLTLGRITRISLGRTGIPFPSGVRRWELNLLHREAHKIFNRQYLFATLGFVTQFEDNRLNDTVTSLRLRYYNKLLPSQTLAFNFVLNYGNRLEESRQFLVGGDSGLRGYLARQFSGVKSVLLNFEDRIFSNLNLLSIAFGGVLFLDAGNAWKEEETLNLLDLNYSVGFGLRLGYTKSPRSRVGRIDFAWPLNKGAGFSISVGVDQIFSMN